MKYTILKRRFHYPKVILHLKTLFIVKCRKIDRTCFFTRASHLGGPYTYEDSNGHAHWQRDKVRNDERALSALPVITWPNESMAKWKRDQLKAWPIENWSIWTWNFVMITVSSSRAGNEFRFWEKSAWNLLLTREHSKTSWKQLIFITKI
jgi:hypothetical protein